MIWFATEGYAPDEPEGAGKSDYISKKDLKWILFIILAVGIILVPVWRVMDENNKRQVCSTSLKNIGAALLQYATNNNDRFPPAYVLDAEGNIETEPIKGESERLPVVWASHLGDYIPKSVEFACRSSQHDEGAHVFMYSSTRSWSVHLTYGLYAPLSGLPVGDVINPDNTIMLAETSNQGAADSFDPQPILNANGKPTANGFLIGWDNGNFNFSRETKAVTRLAFRGTANGEFNNPEVRARHGQGLNAITADGGFTKLSAPDALVRHKPPYLDGLWQTPPTFNGVWGP